MDLLINTGIVNIGSKIGSYCLAFAMIYFVYNLIFKHIFRLDNFILFKKIFLSDVLSIVFTIYMLIVHVTIK